MEANNYVFLGKKDNRWGMICNIFVPFANNFKLCNLEMTINVKNNF